MSDENPAPVFAYDILSLNINYPQEDVLLENKTELGVSVSNPATTFANDYHWRSTKAKQQLRDRFGRWISLGANVRFQANGQEQSGVVTSVIDGKAYVDMKNLNGTVTQQILDPGALRVIASKATLPPDGTKINDPGNNFAKALQTPEYQKALQDHGQAVIQRADGFSLAANVDTAQGTENKAQGTGNKTLDGTENVHDKVGGNPVLFQLFAPGGRSLGKYSQAGAGDFDAMVDDYKSTTGVSPADGGPAPTATSSVTASGEEKPYRVPDAVKDEIRDTLTSFASSMPEADLAIATRLANEPTVSRSDVEWIHGYFCENDLSERIRGGYRGRKWASKVIDTEEGPEEAPEAQDTFDGHPKYVFDDDTFAYFAIGNVEGSTLVHSLISVDYETGAVYFWTPDGFTLQEDLDMTEVDEPQITPIDEITADEFAHWLDSGTPGEYDLLNADAEERNLFSLAEAEIDFEELDRAYSIIAAGGAADPTDGVYTPVERSQNAKVQARGAGGRFGQQPGKGKTPVDMSKPATAAPTDPATGAPVQDSAPKVKKATLPVALPLVANPAQRIAEWLSTAAEAPVVAAGEPSDAPAADPSAPEYTPKDQAAEDASTGPTDEALYFAEVDDVDKTAVLDAIAIVKQDGQPVTYLRKDGAWVADPGTLTILQGSTPPAVVELKDPETIKNVLSQIDAHDSGADSSSDAAAPQPGEVAIAASGFAMPDGSYTIFSADDLQEAVLATGGTPNLFVKAHIRKRARALNRMDLIPKEWREFTLAEIGELSASKSVYGEFGEIIVASGVGRGHGPQNEAKLRAYWTTGKGALKIRWGTKGDLTRAHRHLAKFVGPDRAWGLAQSYHKTLFGVYNYTHDVATGQYVPHHRRKK